MATNGTRRLDDGVKAKAGLGAKRAPTLNFAESIRRHIEPLGGVELDIPSREPVRTPPAWTA